jgi:hypothetical protein
VAEFDDYLLDSLDLPKDSNTAPRASAQRYEPPLQEFEDDKLSAPCDYPLKKEVIESAPSVKSGSTTLS